MRCPCICPSGFGALVQIAISVANFQGHMCSFCHGMGSCFGVFYFLLDLKCCECTDISMDLFDCVFVMFANCLLNTFGICYDVDTVFVLKKSRHTSDLTVYPQRGGGNRNIYRPTPAPRDGGPSYAVLLDGWRCCSQKRNSQNFIFLLQVQLIAKLLSCIIIILSYLSFGTTKFLQFFLLQLTSGEMGEQLKKISPRNTGQVKVMNSEVLYRHCFT